VPETHTYSYSPEKPGKKPGLPRQYLVIALAALGISLLLSPPTLRTEPAGARPDTGVVIKDRNQLTIRLSQNLGRGEFGVAAKDLRTGETFALVGDQKFDAASTMKLVIVGYMYHEASNNRFDLDEVLTIPAGNVQHYGTGIIQYQPGPYRYSYRDLAKLMMEKSDNTAAFVLANNLDKAKLQAFADEAGLTETSIADNSTTPGDMVKLLEKLYRNELADPGLSKDMLEILDDSDFEERLPPKLPAGTKVYHKTGDAFNGGLHDAGIVVKDGHAYAVAIFTQGLSPDQDKAKAKIAEASRDIYAYFLGR
jgi:beta-lactamase class A